MKKIVIFLIVLAALQSCTKSIKPNNSYVSFSGKIENTTDTILTLSNRTFKKEIAIQADGSFKDTLHIQKGDYFSLATNNKNNGFVYLKNGFDLSLTADNNSFAESIEYGGVGGSTNNYLLAQYNYGKSLGDLKELFKLEKSVFKTKVSSLRNSFDSIQSLFKNIDTTLLNLVTKQHQNFYSFLEKNYEVQHSKGIEEELFRKKLSKGKSSPKFYNYVNYKGGTTSLDSFKGRYVYIDVWATWCKPCLAQIPALKQLEEKYHGKNIQFVSISIDDQRTAGSWDKAATKWKKMVNSKNLTGVQLFAGQDLQFIEDYQISSIPRFILIDPKGNIVDANAPRPSDPQLVAIFNGLGI